MKTIEIEALHDRAVHCYVAGLYNHAKEAWEEILSVEPADARSAEGLRMLELLARRTAGDSGTAADMATGAASELTKEIERVDELARSSRYKEAMDAAELLCAAHAASVEAHELRSRVRRKFESEPFIAGELDRARRARNDSDLSEVRAACRRILALDPENRIAARLLEDPQGDWFRALQAKPTPGSPTASDVEGEDTRVELQVAPESAAGTIFEMPPGDLDEGIALGLPSEGGAEEAPAYGGTPAFQPEGETTFDASFATLDAEGPAKNSFSELESEIDETLGVIEACEPAEPADSVASPQETGNASAPSPGETPWPEPDAAGLAPEAEAAADLTFAEEAPASGDDGQVWASSEAPETTEARFEAVARAVEQALDPKLAAYITEARSLIDAGRYSEAIETASRAFAMDPDAPGAQDLIDEARAHLDEVDRQSEEHLYNAQKFLEEGDDSAAEALLREVLRTHPGHREAVDLLARMSRRKDKQDPDEAPSVAPPELIQTAHEPSAAATVAIPRPVSVQPAEPFTPRPYAKEASEEDDRQPVPERVTGAEPKRTGRSIYRQIFWGIVIVGVMSIAAMGLIRLPKYFIGGGEESQPDSPIATKTEKIQVPIPASGPSSTPAAEAQPAPAKADPLPGVPRTFEQGRALVTEGKLPDARLILTDVLKREPANRQAAELLASVRDRLQEREQIDQTMNGIQTAFKQDRFEDALRMLYRLPQPMQRGDVERFKRNAWYNNALSYMLGGNITESTRCFKEVIEIDPADADAKHLMEFLRTYQGKEKDRSYYTYVESLPKRTIDAR